ncbi:MAG TPA: hypothetical protein VH520_03380 [Streptosporangiaceae bacterium]
MIGREPDLGIVLGDEGSRWPQPAECDQVETPGRRQLARKPRTLVA